MTETRLRVKHATSRMLSGSARLGVALGLSCLLHALVLLPFPRNATKAVPQDLPDVPPPLSATLVPALKTFEEKEPVTPEPPAADVQPKALPQTPESVSSASTFRVRPSAAKPLKGRALQTALAALTRENFYPREAIDRGLEGRVVLLLTLNERGVVGGIEVASSSGHRLLDEAALVAARRIGVLPGGQRQVLLPVDFRLE